MTGATANTATLAPALRRIVSGDGDRVARAQRAVNTIVATAGLRWAGLYDVLADEIAVIAWSGPAAPTYPRFPRDKGLNGAAVRDRAPVVVQDVARDPRYLTTIGGTLGEAIFPILSASGDVVGTLDVEADHVDAFTPELRALLEQCAAAVTALW